MTCIKSFYKSIALSFFITVVAVCIFPLAAHATFISPPRVIIDSNEVADEMVILNRNDQTMIYTFKWLDRLMQDNGKIIDVDKFEGVTDYKSASSVLIYSPRQVILEPGETQRVRFFVKRNEMTEGEYRSHILISGRPVVEPKRQRIEGLGGEIGVIPQAGIPVMVRHGKTKIEIEPELIKVVKEDGKDFLHVKFANKSTRTAYARPTFICKLAGVEEPQIFHGMAVRMYYEAKHFDQKLPIRYDTEEQSVDKCQSLTVEFGDKLDFEYKAKPFYSQVLK